jgi:hypothetical protein
VVVRNFSEAQAKSVLLGKVEDLIKAERHKENGYESYYYDDDTKYLKNMNLYCESTKFNVVIVFYVNSYIVILNCFQKK